MEVVQRRSAALLPEMEIIHEAEEMPAEGKLSGQKGGICSQSWFVSVRHASPSLVILPLPRGQSRSTHLYLAGDDMQDVDGDDDDRLKDYEDAVRALNAQRAKEGIAPIGACGWDALPDGLRFFP